MNRICFLAITSLFVQASHFLLLSGLCVAVTQRPAPYTKIIVLLPGKTSIPDDNLLKIITDPIQISRIAKFVDEQLDSKTGWRPEWDGVSIAPHHFMQLGFYQGDIHKLNFGIGGNFFSSLNKDGYKIKKIPKETWKEFLDLIGVTEEEYHKLLNEQTTPGPWKKK